MLNTLLLKIAKLAVGKQLLQLMSSLHVKLDGNKTEILIALLLIVQLLKMLNLIDAEAAKQIEALLGGGLPMTLLARVNKVIATAEEVAPTLPPEQPDQTSQK